MKKRLLFIAVLAGCASQTQKIQAPSTVIDAKIKMAITVDDLPSHGPLQTGQTNLDVAKQMVTVFKKHGVPEVYGFVNADKSDRQSKLGEVLKFWVDSGYPLGNHTYSHKKLHDVTTAEFIADIDQDEKTIQSFGQKYDWKYFRFPYLAEGETPEKRNEVRKHLFSKGYKIAEVTVDFKDWAWNDAYIRCTNMKNEEQLQWLKDSYIKNAIAQLRKEKKMSQGLFNRQISHILLLHMGSFDAVMLDQLLSAYEKEGVQFIGLAEAMKDKVYSEDPQVAGSFGAVFSYKVMKSKKLQFKDLGVEVTEDYPKLDLSLACQY